MPHSRFSNPNKYVPAEIEPSDHNVCSRCHSRLDTCFICDNTLSEKYIKISRHIGDKCVYCNFLMQDKAILLKPECAEYLYNNKCECEFEHFYIFYLVCETCNNDRDPKIKNIPPII